MGDCSGGQHGVARCQGESLLTHLYDEWSLKAMKPLFLFKVQMAGRPTLAEHRLLDDEEAATGVTRANLVVQRRNTRATLSREAIVPLWDEEGARLRGARHETSKGKIGA